MYKILIVDDSSFMRKIIKDTLSKNGFDKLIEAKNGIDAIDLYKSEKPNLVILDVIMPDKDGFSTLTDIIEIDKKANIIVCSASSNNILIKELVAEGIKGFIVKPFEEKELISTVKRVLRYRKKQG